MTFRLAAAVVLATCLLTTQGALAHDNLTRGETAIVPNPAAVTAGFELPSLAETTAMQAQLLRQLKHVTLTELQQQLDPASITVEMLKTANRVLLGTLQKLQNTL